MQEETNEKTIALYIKTGKLTAQQLQKAMKALLAQMKKQHDKQKIPHGKQTLKQLMKQNAGVSNIEITKDNIKAFESTAKKYGIDFALKKDSTETPPRYLVFFQGTGRGRTDRSFQGVFRKEADAGTKALYPQADCFPQRKGGGSERTAGESQKQRQGDCKMNAINWKKLLLPNIPYLLFVYLFDKVGQAVRLAPGADFSGKVLSLGEGFSMAFANPLPSLAPMDLLIGIFGAVLIRLIVYVKGKNAKKYRKGVEYGSARWGDCRRYKALHRPGISK